MRDHYTYRVTWSVEDDEYIGICVEFPSLSWLASSPDEAFSGIRQLVSECLEDMRSTGETPPETDCRKKLQRQVHGQGTVRGSPRTRATRR